MPYNLLEAISNNFNSVSWRRPEGDTEITILPPVPPRFPHERRISKTVFQIETLTDPKADAEEFLQRSMWGITAKGGLLYTHTRTTDGELILDPSLEYVRGEIRFVASAGPSIFASSRFGVVGDPVLVACLLGQHLAKRRDEVEGIFSQLDDLRHWPSLVKSWAADGLDPVQGLLKMQLGLGEAGQG